MQLSRRGLIGSLLAAPVIIKTSGLLMPIKPVKLIKQILTIYPTKYTWSIIGDNTGNFNIDENGVITAKNIDGYGEFIVCYTDNEIGEANLQQFYVNSQSTLLHQKHPNLTTKIMLRG